jgi:hypothetical protein
MSVCSDALSAVQIQENDMRIWTLFLLTACNPAAKDTASTIDGNGARPLDADESPLLLADGEDGDGSGDGGSSDGGSSDGGSSDGGSSDGGDDGYTGDTSTAEDDGYEITAITGSVEDDCTHAINDELEDASFLALEGQHTLFEDIELCSGESDMYSFEIPAYSWLSLSIEIDGTGSGATDLDLYELVHPDYPIDEDIDFITGAVGSLDILNYSMKSTDFERLAWYNPSSSTRTHHVTVLGYDEAESDYDIRVRTSVWHEERDCDDVFSDDSEDGSCNRIMQFPAAVEKYQGYLVSHEQHYSNLRREVAYLVQWATAEVTAEFPGTNPLGLLDMGQADGDTPGRMDDSLRHPEGTHVNGNDLDIAYYQTGTDNLGREVCENDGYNCTGPATLLDAERTAYFIALLTRSPNLRVIGVDTEVAEDVLDAADDLYDSGMLTSTDLSRIGSYMAYDTEGWPFHHHHMHVSWNWEEGHSGLGKGAPSAGCGFEYTAVLPEKALPVFTR